MWGKYSASLREATWLSDRRETSATPTFGDAFCCDNFFVGDGCMKTVTNSRPDRCEQEAYAPISSSNSFWSNLIYVLGVARSEPPATYAFGYRCSAVVSTKFKRRWVGKTSAWETTRLGTTSGRRSNWVVVSRVFATDFSSTVPSSFDNSIRDKFDNFGFGGSRFSPSIDNSIDGKLYTNTTTSSSTSRSISTP